ncbi:MAG: DUF1990 domain-containing protein [Planctomycetia bacterium]|nr:DUF1990 domain-containing protein [Planctomycetia bacterium]
MLALRKSSAECVRSFLAVQNQLGFTYAAAGATAKTPPADHVVDHTRIRLGHGEAVFQAGRAALESWQQFSLGWLEAWPPDTAIRPGEVVAVVARAIGLWWLNACRIVYVVHETDPFRRFGFAYGTLPDHAGSGEERFLIEWDRTDDSVWYDILAFSRPRHLLARLGYPWVRRTQQRFGQESAAAMLRAVGAAGTSAS